MDEETRQAFAELMARMNDQHERVMNRLSRIDRETATIHEYLMEIVKSHGMRLRDIEGRLGDQS